MKSLPVSAIALVLMLGLVACDADQPTPSATKPADSALPTPAASATFANPGLVAEPPTGRLTGSASVGEELFDATIIIRNQGTSPLNIVSVTPGPESGDAMKVIGVGIVDLGTGSDRLGLLRTFPPPFANNLKMRDAVGASLPAQPDRRFAVVVKLKVVKAGIWDARSSVVSYQVNGQEHQLIAAQAVRVCVGSASTCR